MILWVLAFLILCTVVVILLGSSGIVGDCVFWSATVCFMILIGLLVCVGVFADECENVLSEKETILMLDDIGNDEEYIVVDDDEARFLTGQDMIYVDTDDIDKIIISDEVEPQVKLILTKKEKYKKWGPFSYSRKVVSEESYTLFLNTSDQIVYK